VFAERQYQDILKSPDTIRYKLYMDRKMKELSKRKEAVRAAQQGTQAHQSAMGQYKKTDSVLREDRDRYDQHTKTLGSFREQAIDMFSRTLAVSDQFDHDSIMRLISLWFANFDDNGIYPRVGESIDRVASRKFVFLAHQLSARLSANDTSLPPTQATPTQHINATSTRDGQNVLRSLILRMCREHPFHSLYQVYCLKPANEPGASQGRRQSGRVEVSSQLDREAAALDIFAALKQDGENVDRVLAVEELCNASLQWAQHPIKKEHSDKRKKAPFTIPDSLLIRRLRDIRVPVTTAYTPLDPTLKYDDCVWVARYEPTYATAGGVNLPKISVCLGSDGVSYKQLVSLRVISGDVAD
jgi:ataxia telangiectasia mutated family protein